jgi:hypothetical protein
MNYASLNSPDDVSVAMACPGNDAARADEPFVGLLWDQQFSGRAGGELAVPLHDHPKRTCLMNV